MLRMIIGALAGAVIGFLQYKYIGCSSGLCPLSSHQWGSTIYGAILGFILVLILDTKK